MIRVLRGLAAGLVGSVAGGATGFALSHVLITTPLQNVLGPRYTEFDGFGVILVTGLSALIAWVGATVAAALGRRRLRSAFGTRILLVLIAGPTLVGLVLVFVIRGNLVWWVVVYFSACLGVLAGGGSALLLDQAASEKPDRSEGPPKPRRPTMTAESTAPEHPINSEVTRP